MKLIKKNQVFLISLVALISSQIVSADFGLIRDRDGFVNVRQSPSLNAQVIARLSNQSVVSCVLEERNAKFCLVSSPELKEGGYIYRDRVDFLKDYTAVPLFTSSLLAAVYKNNSMHISIEAQPADTDIAHYNKSASHHYTKYKGKVFFGTDGELPDQNFIQLTKINIHMGVSTITLKQSDVEHLFLPREEQGRNELSSFKILHKGKDLYLFNSFNQGGAASYHLMIYIHDGKLIDQKLWREEI